MYTGAKAGQGGQTVNVNFPRVRLTTNYKRAAAK